MTEQVWVTNSAPNAVDLARAGKSIQLEVRSLSLRRRLGIQLRDLLDPEVLARIEIVVVPRRAD